MLKLAFRNIFRQKLRTGVTLAAISFGVIALILSGGFVQDVYEQLGEALIHSQSGHLQVSRSGFHEHGTRTPERFLIAEPAPLKQMLLKHSQVEDVMARVNFSGLINNGRTDWPVIGEGVEPEKEAKLGTHIRIVDGQQLRERDQHGVLLGEGVARAMKLRPGDFVTLLVNTAEGARNTGDFTVIGTFQSFSKDYDAYAVRIPLDAAQELLDTRGANSVVVSLKRTEDTAPVSKLIDTAIRGGQLEVKTWQELNEFYQSTVALYERQFGVLQFIVLILVLLSVANSVNMSAFERVGEFGTMMALGNRSRAIFRLVLLENTLLGMCGSILGVALGLFLAWLISAFGIPMPPPPNANTGYTGHIRPVPGLVLIAFCIGFTATLLAAMLPARRVSRIPVVHALMQNY
jgi:putative ABC transport system permease protein